MEKKSFKIANISCGHCTKTIENELNELEGISSVQSSIADKTVTVEWGAPVSEDKIRAVLKEINYPAA